MPYAPKGSNRRRRIRRRKEELGRLSVTQAYVALNYGMMVDN
jgi:hypothetical protein